MSKRHIRWLHNELPALIESRVISEDSAQALRTHYGMHDIDSADSLPLVTLILATLGGLLIGGGIILILAHNWENLDRTARAVLAFVPLLISQGLVIFALVPKKKGPAWREVSGVLLFCCVAASISIIGQTYHISGDTQAFLSMWFLLILPFVYLLQAHLMTLLMMVLATVLSVNYSSPYLLTLFALAPYYWRLQKSESTTRAIQAAWVYALCLLVSIPANVIANTSAILPMLGIMSGAMCAYLIGRSIETEASFWQRPLTNISAICLAGCAIGLTFTDFLLDIIEPNSWHYKNHMQWHQIALIISFTLTAFILLAVAIKRKTFDQLPLASLFLLFILFISVSLLLNEHAYSQLHVWVWALTFSLAVICVGIWYIYLGISSNSTSQLNFGLLLIMTLLMMKFFDQDFTLISRGISFIAIGIVFICVNLWHSRRASL